ncbi:MAG: hypothetical protein OEM32_00690 [Acidimicrobiia bacterium]|nr:hypothetical protein [Acidimicrobiia bacterium]
MSEEWYYCVEHKAVEPKLGCRILDRLGPYSTREAAERALETVEKRNVAWDQEDRDFD